MRIAVVGTSGAGKTTLGRRLAQTFGLPFIELDALNWEPGWRALSAEAPDEFHRRVAQAIAAPAWVCDGNYGPVRRAIWSRATHLVWLDYDRATIMRRVVARSILRALDSRPLWAGNREDWRRWWRSSHPIRWAWSTWRRRRSEYEVLIADPDMAHIKIHRLRRPKETDGLAERLSFR